MRRIGRKMKHNIRRINRGGRMSTDGGNPDGARRDDDGYLAIEGLV